MSENLPRCDKCGALRVNDPNKGVRGRLEKLGYIAQDAYHEFGGGRTYHGHALPDYEGHDGFEEVLQNHDSGAAHEAARRHFEESAVVCPRHYEKPKFVKSVAPSANPRKELYAQGKCETCEYIALVVVHDAE